MKLIEADKVEQAIKDYWKAQVDKLPKPGNVRDHDDFVDRLNSYIEHNHELLKAVDELPSVEPEAISEWKKDFRGYVDSLDIARDDWKGIIEYIDELPSAQPKQNEMIKEIRRWINSGNRGNSDYFIVDRIEEIINAYEIN